jgi:peroxiredoxin
MRLFHIGVMALEKGSKAPLFTLKSKTTEGLVDFSLESNLGKKKTVLLFFPLAFTSVCQDELCSVSAGLERYEKVNAEVWGISVDSPFSQEAFARQAGIKVPLLSDFNKEVSAAYDVLYADLLGFKGVSKRSAFVIDEEGAVAYAWSSDNPMDLPPFEEVEAAL